MLDGFLWWSGLIFWVAGPIVLAAEIVGLLRRSADLRNSPSLNERMLMDHDQAP